MAFTKNNEEAVSPVIGVILMVAITVILAAVIAAFVFGMAGNISKTKVVAVTVTKTNDHSITVMNQGGQDQAALSNLSVTSTPASTALCSGSTGVTGTAICYLPNPQVGSTVVLNGNIGLYTGRTQVVAIGTFNDGSQQVLLDSYV